MRVLKAKVLERSLKINGDRIDLPPLDLQRTLSIIIHLLPYVPLIERYLPDIQAALAGKVEGRPQILYEVFMALRPEFDRAPEDVIKLIGLLLDKPPDWVLANVTSAEIVRIIKSLDQAYDFAAFWAAARSWATIQYVKSD